MSVDKSGNNSSSFEIYFVGCPRSQRLYFFIGADRQKTAAGNGDCFGARLMIVDGDDVSVIKN